MRSRVLRAVRRVSLVDAIFRLAGLVLAATGLAHLVLPGPFARISEPIFPENTKEWVRVNGLSETAIGVALAGRRTRLFGFIGMVVYLVHLAERAVASTARWFRSPDPEEYVAHGKATDE